MSRRPQSGQAFVLVVRVLCAALAALARGVGKRAAIGVAERNGAKRVDAEWAMAPGSADAA